MLIALFLLPLAGEGGAQSASDEGYLHYCLLPTPCRLSLNKPVQPFNFLLQHARILHQNLAPVDFNADDFEPCERA